MKADFFSGRNFLKLWLPSL